MVGPWGWLLSALATHRLLRLILTDEGPFGVMLWLRGHLDPDGKTWVGRGLACLWCLSFWLGPLCAALSRHWAGRIVVEGLAISSVVSLAMAYGGAIFNRLLGRRV
jgi:hypothetical protein